MAKLHAFVNEFYAEDFVNDLEIAAVLLGIKDYKTSKKGFRRETFHKHIISIHEEKEETLQTVDHSTETNIHINLEDLHVHIFTPCTCRQELAFNNNLASKEEKTRQSFLQSNKYFRSPLQTVVIDNDPKRDALRQQKEQNERLKSPRSNTEQLNLSEVQSFPLSYQQETANDRSRRSVETYNVHDPSPEIHFGHSNFLFKPHTPNMRRTPLPALVKHFDSDGRKKDDIRNVRNKKRDRSLSTTHSRLENSKSSLDGEKPSAKALTWERTNQNNSGHQDSKNQQGFFNEIHEIKQRFVVETNQMVEEQLETQGNTNIFSRSRTLKLRLHVEANVLLQEKRVTHVEKTDGDALHEEEKSAMTKALSSLESDTNQDKTESVSQLIKRLLLDELKVTAESFRTDCHL